MGCGREWPLPAGNRRLAVVTSVRKNMELQESTTQYFRETLEDELVSLIQTREDHFDQLYLLACEPALWAQHPEQDRWREPNFTRFFNAGLANELGCYTIVERASDRMIGMTRFYGFDPAESAVRIGFTFVGLPFWGTPVNGHVKQLMLDHAFERVQTVYFDVGRTNYRSQKAVGKLGAVRCGEDGGNFIFALKKSVWQSR